MPVPRYDVPDYAIGALRQRRQTDFEQYRIGWIHAAVAQVNFFPAHVLNCYPAEGRFEPAVEPYIRADRRGRESLSDPRT